MNNQAQQPPEIAPPELKLIGIRVDLKAKIAQQLRCMYGDVVKEGVPDRFAHILRGLDNATAGGQNEP